MLVLQQLLPSPSQPPQHKHPNNIKLLTVPAPRGPWSAAAVCPVHCRWCSADSAAAVAIITTTAITTTITNTTTTTSCFLLFQLLTGLGQLLQLVLHVVPGVVLVLQPSPSQPPQHKHPNNIKLLTVPAPRGPWSAAAACPAHRRWCSAGSAAAVAITITTTTTQTPQQHQAAYCSSSSRALVSCCSLSCTSSLA